jgi:phenylalanyl-tRNA synthetase alpha chain
MAALDALQTRALEELSRIESQVDGDEGVQAKALEAFRNAYLGKKGEISGLMRHMATLPPEEKPTYGQAVNALRQAVESRVEALSTALESAAIQKELASSKVDPTLPGKRLPSGTLHPLTQVRDEIVDYFVSLGFEMKSAREVDHDWYNFEALNIPPDHPSRDMHDTFYVDDAFVLRTHTSNVQVHTMLAHGKPPLRMIAPGCVYRVDNDATHSPMFQQVECLVVDEGISFAHLKGTLYLWAQKLFGPETRMRFRPSYFPFTEPSAEMDVSCSFCKGKGCRICKQTGWIEIGGCGSVDPAVFQKVGWDPEKVSGFAFGFGIDRIAMLRYDIPDIALFTRNDARFLRQFV